MLGFGPGCPITCDLMARVLLENVTIDLPIFDVSARSLKQTLFKSVGGRVDRKTSRINIRALNDISFELRDGDRLALVGHNGAGKSTLLRTISGILAPAVGRVVTEGMMSSMTDITMGMDMDATGRENIRLRCIFLGMTFGQADALQNEIADFTALGEYLDLPIRTYSTGMLVRLGFAASTAVLPDILVMDEMIGAGDMAFAEKAQARIASYLDGAKIMVLASHNTAMLRNFCNKGLLLEHGQMRAFGDLDTVIDIYEGKAL